MSPSPPPIAPHRPEASGREWAVSTGHPLATLAAARILERGGNAIDAGVAGGLALGVLQPDIVGFAGVAPMILYLAEPGEVVTISGLGRWPRAASREFFVERCGGEIPLGVLRCVTPAAIDAWTTALARFGSMRFAEVAEAALVLAREGFAAHRLLCTTIAEDQALYARWPASAALFLPEGRPPRPGERFRQPDLARTIARLIEAEARASGGREAGLAAVRDAFHEGAIAAEIAAFFAAEGGLLGARDLADFRVEVEPPVAVRFGDWEVFACGPWCQGPMLLQFLELVAGEDLAAMGWGSEVHLHRLTELMKLGFADREAFYGDPEFVDVPLATLLDRGYAQARRRLVGEEAVIGLPPAGDLGLPRGRHAAPIGAPGGGRDTTYLCVADRWGNGFSATPSDGYSTAPVIPGLGFAVSTRGDQSWLEPDHPSVVAPWKRPRLTPNPALALKGGALALLFGTPGGDVQCQAMLEVFLNMAVFGMGPQAAIEAPRFASASFPDSFWPHAMAPGLLRLEPGLAAAAEALAARGHRIELWPERHWRAGGVCAIALDGDFRVAAADPRRECYALAW